MAYPLSFYNKKKIDLMFIFKKILGNFSEKEMGEKRLIFPL